MRQLFTFRPITRTTMMNVNVALAIVVCAALGFAGQATVACAICGMVTAAYGIKAVQDLRSEKGEKNSA